MQNSVPHNKVLRNNVPKHWTDNGNDTDASGSTETLSVEEQHAIWHMQRQEPQGQEQNHGAQSTVIAVGSSDSSQASSLARNNDSNLSFGSSTNTLIIHHSVPDESWSNRWLAGYTSHNMSQNSGANFHTSYVEPSKNAFTSSLYLRGNSSHLQDNSVDYSKNSKMNNSSRELKEIPNSYLDKSEILKHLVAKDQNKYKDVAKPLGRNYSKEAVSSLGGSSGLSDQSASSSSSGLNALPGDMVTPMPRSSPQYHNLSPMMNRMPPPYYSRFQHDKYDHQETDFYNGRRSVDKNTGTLSGSQPGLGNVGISKELTPTKDLRLHPLYSEDESSGSLKEMIDILNNENHTLKIEIDYFHRKVTKLQKFEAEMVKVEEQHQSLVKMGERREQLERLARYKLHCEVRRLTELNAELKEQIREHSFSDVKSQVDAGIHRASMIPDDSELVSLKKELGRKDTIISQLVSQNRELTTAKSESEKESLNKDKKIKEQQKQIDILDSALTSTQTTVLKLEDEVKKNQYAVDQAEQLRKVLLSMQRASTRLDQSEKNIKQKLEDEIVILRSKNKVDTTTSEVLDMRAEIRTKDEKILFLESEMAKMKQKIMLEAFKNQIDADYSANGREQLETSQHEKEIRISQTKLDHIKSSDEYQNMCKRMEELELCNRSLEAIIAEREAKIKALNRKAEENYSIVLSQSNAALNISAREDKNVKLRRDSSVGSSSSSRSIPRKDEELGDISSLLSFLSNLSLVSEDSGEITEPEQSLETPQLSPVSRDTYVNLEKFCALPKNKKFILDLMDSKEKIDPQLSNDSTSVSTSKEVSSPSAQTAIRTIDDATNIIAEKENSPPLCSTSDAPNKVASDAGKITIEAVDTKEIAFVAKEPDCADKVNIPFSESSRIAPPPYHGHHQLLKNDISDIQVGAPNVGSCSHKKHGSNIFCRSCQNVRRSVRQVPLVRRANSSACHPNRRSVPSPSSSLDSLEDAPSILERLRKEWELGMLSGPSKDSAVDGSRTLPYSLATVMNLSQSEETERHLHTSKTKKELRQFSNEMSNLIESKSGSQEQKLQSKEEGDKKLELIIREDSDEKI